MIPEESQDEFIELMESEKEPKSEEPKVEETKVEEPKSEVDILKEQISELQKTINTTTIEKTEEPVVFEETLEQIIEKGEF